MKKVIARCGLVALAITVKVGPESIRIDVTDRDRQMLPGVTRSWGTATISK